MHDIVCCNAVPSTLVFTEDVVATARMLMFVQQSADQQEIVPRNTPKPTGIETWFVVQDAVNTYAELFATPSTTPNFPILCNIDIPNLVFVAYESSNNVHILELIRHKYVHGLDMSTFNTFLLELLSSQLGPQDNDRVLSVYKEYKLHVNTNTTPKCLFVDNTEPHPAFAKDVIGSSMQCATIEHWNLLNGDSVFNNPDSIAKFQCFYAFYMVLLNNLGRSERNLVRVVSMMDIVRSTWSRCHTLTPGAEAYLALLTVGCKGHLLLVEQKNICNHTTNGKLTVVVPPKQNKHESSRQQALGSDCTSGPSTQWVNDVQQFIRSQTSNGTEPPSPSLRRILEIATNAQQPHSIQSVESTIVDVEDVSKRLLAVGCAARQAVCEMQGAITDLANQCGQLYDEYMARTLTELESDKLGCNDNMNAKAHIINMVAIAELSMRQFYSSLPPIIESQLQGCAAVAGVSNGLFGRLELLGYKPQVMVTQSKPNPFAITNTLAMGTVQAAQTAVSHLQSFGAHTLNTYMTSGNGMRSQDINDLYHKVVHESVYKPVVDRLLDAHHPSFSSIAPQLERDAAVHFQMCPAIFASTILLTNHRLNLLYGTTPMVTAIEVGVACGFSRPDLWTMVPHLCQSFYTFLLTDLTISGLAKKMVVLRVYPGKYVLRLMFQYIVHVCGLCTMCGSSACLANTDLPEKMSRFVSCPSTVQVVDLLTAEWCSDPSLASIQQYLQPTTILTAVQQLLQTEHSPTNPVLHHDSYNLRDRLLELQDEFESLLESQWPILYEALTSTPINITVRAFPLALRGMMVSMCHIKARTTPPILQNYHVRTFALQMQETNITLESAETVDDLKQFIRNQVASTNCLTSAQEMASHIHKLSHDELPEAEVCDDNGIDEEGDHVDVATIIQEIRTHAAAASTLAEEILLPPKAWQILQQHNLESRSMPTTSPAGDLVRAVYNREHSSRWTTKDAHMLATHPDVWRDLLASVGEIETKNVPFNATKALSPTLHEMLDPPLNRVGRLSPVDHKHIRVTDGYCSDVDIECDVFPILRHYDHIYGGASSKDEDMVHDIWHRCADAVQLLNADTQHGQTNRADSKRDPRRRVTYAGDNLWTQKAEETVTNTRKRLHDTEQQEAKRRKYYRQDDS